MHFTSLASSFVSLYVVCICGTLALPLPLPVHLRQRRSPAPAPRPLSKVQGQYDVPIIVKKREAGDLQRRNGSVSGTIGLGDNSDLLYTVPIQVGSITTAVHLDTGSSDLWFITDACTSGTCAGATATRYTPPKFNSSGADVVMTYGDSTTGTNATGPVVYDTVALAGVAIENQAFSAANYTDNPTITYGAGGILGLGFPSGSNVQEALVTQASGPIVQTDSFVEDTFAYGPTLGRMAMTGALAEPRFAIALQRDTIEIGGGGTGTLSVGKLPDGVSESDLTWVPVRLYTPADGGLAPPSFAPNEVYPFRWEIDIDAVFLDGKQLPASTVPATGGVDTSKTSALIDTGNSLIRGPSDVVANILQTVSGNAANTLPCATPHTLSFQIGGKQFPINPLDFITQQTAGDAKTCVASNIVATDPPSFGALFRWSMGDPFFKSNTVVFHYGNLTNPSVDPPMIGLLSNVPQNTTQELQQAVNNAQANGGNFASTLQAAPTAQAEALDDVTIFPGFSGSASAPAATIAQTTPAAAVSPTVQVQSPPSSGSGSDGEDADSSVLLPPAQSSVLSPPVSVAPLGAGVASMNSNLVPIPVASSLPTSSPPSVDGGVANAGSDPAPDPSPAAASPTPSPKNAASSMRVLSVSSVMLPVVVGVIAGFL